MSKAKTLTDDQFYELMAHVARASIVPVRDTVIFLFSFKAGLRSGEIAGLDWRDVCDTKGQIGQVREIQGKQHMCFTVPARCAKKGHTRIIPMHPELFTALCLLRNEMFDGSQRPKGRIIRGMVQGLVRNTSEKISSNALRVYMKGVYDRAGMDATSHSGRRTFVTKAIRKAALYNCSIKDVQVIAGHKFMDTTERYIEPSADISKLIEDL